MRTRRLVPALFIGAAAFAFAGCATTAGSEGGTMEPADYVGATFASSEAGDPFISFSDDGTFEGNDGCNGFGGTYEVEDDRIVLDRVGVATLKGCMNVDDWLRGADSLQIADETMTVFNSSGDEIGTLAKS
ncbi:META domain-containing protein [Microbacterium faecale]|nr:META domain-containing protein [Microbacterium faecale]